MSAEGGEREVGGQVQKRGPFYTLPNIKEYTNKIRIKMTLVMSTPRGATRKVLKGGRHKL